jgi:hypothetical protein
LTAKSWFKLYKWVKETPRPNDMREQEDQEVFEMLQMRLIPIYDESLGAIIDSLRDAWLAYKNLKDFSEDSLLFRKSKLIAKMIRELSGNTPTGALDETLYFAEYDIEDRKYFAAHSIGYRTPGVEYFCTELETELFILAMSRELFPKDATYQK